MTLEHASDAEVRRLADEILLRPEFESSRAIDLTSLPLLSYLQDWLDWLNGWLAETLAVSPMLFWALLLGLALIAVLLVAHLVWTIRIALRAGVAEVTRQAATEARDFLDEAQTLAAHSRFLEAAHCLELACIALLLQRRVLSLSRSEPNRTLRRRIADAAIPEHVRRTLLALLDRTETAWFRDRADDPSLYAAWQDLHTQLQTLPVRSA